MKINQYELRILVNGHPVQEFHKDNNTFIESRVGTEYSLQIRNHSYNRILAIPSIDGINAITGEPAKPGDTGYIVNANDTLEIKGFRKDMETVGAFKFCRKDRSYCNEAGAPGNNGVIGALIFEEKVDICIPSYWTITSDSAKDIKYVPGIDPGTGTPPWTLYNSQVSNNINCSSTSNRTLDCYGVNSKSRSLYSGDVKCCTSVKEDPFGVGTTWGQQKSSHVVQDEFNIGNQVAELVIYYASQTGLKSLGVPMIKKEQVVLPSAFGKFATPPKNWNSK